jgi:hypothetical protein
MDTFWWAGLGTIVANAVAALLVGTFLPGYVKDKAKNLATKEDIGAITREVKKVEDEYARGLAELLQRLRTAGDLRLAAANERLKAHQEAFALWREMIGDGHTESLVGPLVMKCQDWWEKNCLYLSPNASTAFFRAYAAVNSQLEIERTRDAVRVADNWATVRAAGDAILEGASLPSLGGVDQQRIASSYPLEAKATVGVPPAQ